MVDTGPLCFVLMPFGVKGDARGREIDFDQLYEKVYRPAVTAAGMEPVRGDEEAAAGIIQKALYERLVLCPYALADLTLANANVFYELGVRHAVRPHTTVMLFEKGAERLPFDVQPLRAIPYAVDDSGVVRDPDSLRRDVATRLDEARDPSPDSPVYQLLEGFQAPDIAHLRADTFRERARYNEDLKRRLRDARSEGLASVRAIHEEIKPLGDQEAGVVIDLMLSYRDVKDYEGMIACVGEMHGSVSRSVLVKEQYGFALNRAGRPSEARETLEGVLEEHGPSSETYGLLGRVYKDLWQDARQSGRGDQAEAYLRRAIDAYRKGFEADWRDAYPGVNALTLMEIGGPGSVEVRKLGPVVQYAIERRLGAGGGDYWDHASLLEVSVINRDYSTAQEEVGECLASEPAGWMVETTVRNLSLLMEARESEGEGTADLASLIERLQP